MKQENNIVVLSLGANLGDKKSNFEKVLTLIESRLGLIVKKSSILESEPWGFNSCDIFNNQIVVIETVLSPEKLLTQIWEIEKLFGRKKEGVDKEVDKYSERKKGILPTYLSRYMDIDILYYNNEVINTPLLDIPHPHVDKRMFILTPLAEILPYFTHPQLNKTTLEMIEDYQH